MGSVARVAYYNVSAPLIAAFSILASGCAGSAGGSGPTPPNESGHRIHAKPAHVKRLAASGTTIPYWESSFTYDGVTYPYKMVGTSPFAAAATTTIPNEIVPLNVTFASSGSSGQNFNAGGDISVLTGSPLYTSASFGTVGTTQFGDAVMRSEFWSSVTGTNYHVLLGTPTIEPTQAITIPAADGYTTTSGGVTTGYIQFNYFMSVVETDLVEKLKIRPTTMTLFATIGIKLLEPDGNYCCYSGYHNDLSITTSSASGIFTTVWGNVSSEKSVPTLSHEVAEWLNDPFYKNAVPPWVQPGETACGGGDLEVGDPVTNYSFTVNGYTLQDIVGYSWFSRLVPSIGIDPFTDKPSYDLLGKLTGPASNCKTSSPGPSPSPSPSPSATPSPSPSPSPSARPSPSPSPSPSATPTPSSSPTPRPFGPVRIDPQSLKFDHLGLDFEKKVHVAQRNFDGKFSNHGTCGETKTASVRWIDDGKGKGTYEVIPRRTGRCYVTFVGGGGKDAKLDVVIEH